MRLFDKLTGSKKVELTPKSALVLSAITVIAADVLSMKQRSMTLQRSFAGTGNRSTTRWRS